MISNNHVIFLHLFYCDLWEEISDHLKGLLVDFTLYVNLVEGNEDNDATIEKIKQQYPLAVIIITSNQGMGVSGYLRLMDLWFKSGGQEEFMIFIHSKKSIKSTKGEDGNNWRKSLLKIVDVNYYNEIMELFNCPETGMVGSKQCLFSYDSFPYEPTFYNGNKENIDKYCNLFGIQDYVKNLFFIGGGMFWVRSKIYKEVFCNHPLIEISNEMEYGYNKSGFTKMHAFERIFGAIIGSRGYKIIGI